MLSNIDNKTDESPFFSQYIPDIQPFFYGPKSIVEIIDRYLLTYSDCKTADFIKFKNLLLEYKHLLYSEQKSSINFDIINQLFELMELSFKNCDFEIFARTKSFCKVCTKAYLFSKDNLDINKIQDLSGYRFILYSDSVRLCSDVMNTVLLFLTENKGFRLLEAEPLLGTEGFCQDDFPEIVTSGTYILPKFEYAVKNYIKHPKKKNCYQSLHAALLNPFTKQKTEIQVRNTHMHKRAVLDHEEYKSDRYSNNLDFSSCINYSNIQLNGFISKNGIIMQDSQGFIQSTALPGKYKFF